MSAGTLKTKFATGKKPTGADFDSLIDEVDGKTKPSDLTDLAKKSELTGLAKKSDLTDLAKKSDLTGLAKTVNVPTKVEYEALVKRVEALEAP